MDFEVPDEMGSFLGNKIYSHHIHERCGSEQRSWWSSIILRESREDASSSFRTVLWTSREFRRPYRLLRSGRPCHTLQIGHQLGRVEVLSTGQSLSSHSGRDRPTGEGRPFLGRLKPKRIHHVESEAEFQRAVGRLEA